MDFSFDTDHVEMAGAVRELLTRDFPAEALRSSAGDRSARRKIWDQLAGQGLHATLVPEARGGLELGWEAAVLCLTELGRAAVPGPFIDSVAVAPALLASAPGDAAADLLTRLAEGATTVGVAEHGGLVACAEDVEVVLVIRGEQITALSVGPGSFIPVPTLDESMPLSRLSGGEELFTVEVTPGDVRFARASGALAASAQLIGATRRIIDMTVGYVAQREQFGRTIGSFQAVQHALVDAALKQTFAEPVVHAAAWAMGDGDYEAPVSHAKIAASDAAHLASRTGFQLHGAIGYTYEYDLHLWLKRAKTLTGLYGTPSHHRARLREHVLSLAEAS
ncbi:acyl-CoA dehydrogenase family protein [Actinocorallia sp. B10E7]|uniref:acyl-CoA dehydrogenase family protein n=1 Tax=Actinocorallia sp. B10E7 TaxID=3153558 RepID=UPI00325E5383